MSNKTFNIVKNQFIIFRDAIILTITWLENIAFLLLLQRHRPTKKRPMRGALLWPREAARVQS